VAACVEELAFDLAFESLTAQREALTLLPSIFVVTTGAEGSFSIDGARLYADLTPADASLEEAYVALAEEIRETRHVNRRLVDRVVLSLRLGFAALIVEVILLLAALAVH
jgi:hypothetical protein